VTVTATISRNQLQAQATRYVGVSDWWGRHVWLERDGTRSSLAYRGDEPLAGFVWGRRGLGARELSRSILHDATGSAMLAERFCRDLTHEVVSQLPEMGFELERSDVLAWLEARQAGL
jgi:hypothetical protein